MSPLTRAQLDAAAQALNRAADHFERRVQQMDARMARWRKDHRRDDTPVVAGTLTDVVRQLRRWAQRCEESSRGNEGQ